MKQIWAFTQRIYNEVENGKSASMSDAHCPPSAIRVQMESSIAVSCSGWEKKFFFLNCDQVQIWL